jgi:hypothetical protein
MLFRLIIAENVCNLLFGLMLPRTALLFCFDLVFRLRYDLQMKYINKQTNKQTNKKKKTENEKKRKYIPTTIIAALPPRSLSLILRIISTPFTCIQM